MAVQPGAMLSETELASLFETMLEEMPEHIVDRGRTYFTAGRVARVWMERGMVFGIVQGTDTYRVQMDPARFPLGASCTCPYDGLCKHMAAVVFALAARGLDDAQAEAPGEVSDAGTNVADSVADTHHAHAADGAEPAGLAQASQTRPKRARAQRAKPDDPAGWFGVLNQALAKAETVLRRNPFTSIDVLFAAFKEAVERAAPAEEGPVAALWRIFAAWVWAWFVLTELLPRVRNYPWLKRGFKEHAQRILVDELEIEWTQEALATHAATTQVLADWLRQRWWAELDSEALLEFTFLYLFTYDSLLIRTISPEKERSALAPVWEHWERVASAERAKTPLTHPRLRSLRLVQILLLLWSDHADEAMALAETLGQPQADEADAFLLFCFSAMRHRVRDGLAWVSWLDSHWEDPPDFVLTGIGQMLREVSRIVPAELRAAVDSTLFSFLQRHLPVTKDILAAVALEREDWPTWVHVQMASGRLPSWLPPEVIRRLEREHPELLIPWYHQVVERLVQEKTRDAYKEAVRWLSKLSTLYRKAKRLPAWQAFLPQFVQRHSRRRTLLTEMERKKLMPT
ncbi:hypothetical protein GCM10010885_16970 [Alicyclobacillus cellulosilyticus]|uniref:SWIM-type domain-containing protein n=1 Tax=Alicyclobacillus cellulosilyticus TaxID=1003997 RepID=A0A917NKQ2_9BACL|nr:SWIM zinc finger family protein [Alicyclobacillus cellulosilyticus]GGJ08450.1 hypothetical protein GCM10010885_16970 [Alicyclobacillus cellulosilyticus]